MWSDQQIKTYVQRLIKDIGRDGWALCTVRIRRALVAEKAFEVCRHQVSDTVNVAAMNELYVAMLRCAALDDEC